jgi:hypothetical protein
MSKLGLAEVSTGLDPNKDPNNPAWDSTRQRIERLIEQKEVTGRRLSTESGMSESALNQFLNRKAGSTRYDRVVERLQTWLDTRERREQAQSAFPDAPGFRLTATAERILDVFQYAHHAPDMGCVYGAAGVGKTEAAREYVRNNSGVCLSTMNQATRSPFPALREIAKCVGVRDARTQSGLMDRICEEIRQTRGLLIIDEAHELHAAALDQIRHIHDIAGVGVVLMGNETVFSSMTNPKTAQFLDRVYSRVGMWLGLHTGQGGNVNLGRDAPALLDAWGVDDAEARRLLRAVANKPGALRIMVKVLRFAVMLAGGEPLAARHIRVAQKKMGAHVATPEV